MSKNKQTNTKLAKDLRKGDIIRLEVDCVVTSNNVPKECLGKEDSKTQVRNISVTAVKEGFFGGSLSRMFAVPDYKFEQVKQKKLQILGLTYQAFAGAVVLAASGAFVFINTLL